MSAFKDLVAHTLLRIALSVEHPDNRQGGDKTLRIFRRDMFMLVHAFLDIDGVLVGKQDGKNFPLPSQAIRLALKRFQATGHRITLCTGRGAFATRPLIEELQLPGPHIADGGVIIFDPLAGQVLRQLPVPQELLQAPYKILKNLGVYVSLIGPESFHVEHGADPQKVATYERITGQAAQYEENLEERFLDLPVSRLFFIADSEEQAAFLHEKIKVFEDMLDLTWSSNPNALPHLYGWFMQKGVSKGESLQAVLAMSGKEEKRLLIGAGDNASDWDFLKLCHHKGIMGNASKALVELVEGEAQDGVAWLAHVDEDGLLPFLERFIARKI